MSDIGSPISKFCHPQSSLLLAGERSEGFLYECWKSPKLIDQRRKSPESPMFVPQASLWEGSKSKKLKDQSLKSKEQGTKMGSPRSEVRGPKVKKLKD